MSSDSFFPRRGSGGARDLGRATACTLGKLGYCKMMSILSQTVHYNSILLTPPQLVSWKQHVFSTRRIVLVIFTFHCECFDEIYFSTVNFFQDAGHGTKEQGSPGGAIWLFQTRSLLDRGQEQTLSYACIEIMSTCHICHMQSWFSLSHTPNIELA